jgi:hypothetical protein
MKVDMNNELGWLMKLQIWLHNVPHMGLVSYKKDQNWVRQAGDKLLFPGGGTQFKTGAGHYIDFIQEVRIPSSSSCHHSSSYAVSPLFLHQVLQSQIQSVNSLLDSRFAID